MSCYNWFNFWSFLKILIGSGIKFSTRLYNIQYSLLNCNYCQLVMILMRESLTYPKLFLVEFSRTRSRKRYNFFTGQTLYMKKEFELKFIYLLATAETPWFFVIKIATIVMHNGLISYVVFPFVAHLTVRCHWQCSKKIPVRSFIKTVIVCIWNEKWIYEI